MDILGFVTDYVPRRMAGSEITMHSIFAWLASRGHRVRVAMPADLMPRNLKFDGVELIAKNSTVFVEALKQADIYFTHLESVEEATRHASKTGKAVVHYVHKDSDLTYKGIVQDHLDLAVFNSYALATEKVRASYPSLVVYPPVPRAKSDPEAVDKRTNHTLVGLSKNKGGDFLLTLAAAAKEEHFLGVHGSYDKQVRIDRRKNLDLEPTTPNIQEIFQKTRVLLIPSHVETWGRIGVEAMWAGIPVIANSECTNSGFRECLGTAALWAPRSNKDEWVDALQQLRDPKTFREMQDRGLNRAAVIHERTEFQLHCLERALASLVNRGHRRRVHFFASETHYFRHLSGVCHATPADSRGLMIVPLNVRRDALLEGHRVYTPGGSKTIHSVAAPASSLAYCVSMTDHTWAEGLAYAVVRAEHGAGQTYKGVHSFSYAGSEQHGRARLCLYPGKHPWSVHVNKRCPSPSAVVGSPILERWLHSPEKPAVGFAFHWDCQVCPETKATFHIWSKAIPSVIDGLSRKGIPVYFHCHPRYVDTFKRAIKNFNQILILDRDLFLGSITVLAADNTSLMFEAAACGRMVVVLNSPTYRRNIEHGLRFWVVDEVGVPCDDPKNLLSCVQQALNPSEEDITCRDSALQYVYAADRPIERTIAHLVVTLQSLPGYDVSGLREVSLLPAPNTEGLWKLLMSKQSEDTVIVTKRDEVNGEDYKPGQLVSKSDPNAAVLLERKSASDYGKEKKAL